MIEIKKSELIKKIEEGYTVVQLAALYVLPVNAMRNCLKQAGLSIKRNKPKFKLIEDVLPNQMSMDLEIPDQKGTEPNTYYYPNYNPETDKVQ